MTAPTSDDLQQQHRQQMHDAILQHARDVMRERGAGGLSLGEVARRLGIKTPSLYEYFANKHAIYDAIFRQGYEQFGAHMRALMEGHEFEGMRPNLTRLMRGYLDFALENPELYQLMFERPIPGFVPSEESLVVSFGVLQESYEAMAVIVVNDEHVNIPADLHPKKVHNLILALNHGLTALHLANEPDTPLPESRFGSLIDVAVDTLMRAWTQEDES